MKLTTRLLCFFLGTIAVVLVAFDGALYGLAHVHLQRQLDERLDAALATLSAAIEVHPDNLEWEPEERTIRIGPDTGPEALRWTLRDSAERLVDYSPNFRGDAQQAHTFDAAPDDLTTWQGEKWQLARRTMSAPAPTVHDTADGKLTPPLLFAGLRLAIGASLSPMRDTLRSLTAVLLALSAGVWLAAAMVGRRLCRRALAPVLRMTLEAERITADDLARRLPLSGSADEVEQLGRAFNGVLTRLEEAYERQRRFTGDASHQLRTPLTVMLGQVEVALRREREPAEYQRTLEIVRKRIVELQQITEMLLFLARADAEAQLRETETAPVSGVLAEAAERWRPRLPARDLIVEDLPIDRPMSIRIHRPLFAHLLDNLIDNAAKYSPEHSAIHLSAQRHGNVIRLAVRDEGCGIPADEQGQLFAPFFRGREARRDGQPGVGLGLAVAKRIAEVFDGSITLASAAGQGTTFVIALPVAQEPVRPLEYVQNEKEPAHRA